MSELEQLVQLVLTDRSKLTDGEAFGVYSPLTRWPADLGAKHAFLRTGFGWEHMPLAMVQTDLEPGDLVQTRVENLQPPAPLLGMFAVYPKDATPRPAGRWFLDRLKQCNSE